MLVKVAKRFQKTQTTLTYKSIQTSDKYWSRDPLQKNSENFRMTTKTTFIEEITYIGICVGEIFKIVGSHYIKKFAQK